MAVCAQSCSVPRDNTSPNQGSCTTNSIFQAPSSQKELSESYEATDIKKIYKCSICDSVFSRFSHLQDHLNHHIGDHQYHCKEINCRKAYFEWKKLRSHLISSHKLNNVKKSSYMTKGSKRHKCSYEGCNAAYDRPWKLTTHMWKHTGEKPHPCPENGCNKSYTSVGGLRRHTAISHMPSNKKMVMHYICSEERCEKVYKTIENMRRHYLKHHKKDEPQRLPLNCKTCDRNFKSPKRFDVHKCMAYKCEECTIKFTNVAAFKKHMRKTHFLQTCSEPRCTKVFSKFSLLKEHKKTEHTKFICPTCNKKLSSRMLLKSHQQTHLLPEERSLFTCPFSECGRFYKRKFNLDQHIKSSHQGIKFHCTVPGCERSLVTKQKLQEHMKLHDPLREPRQRKQLARRQRRDAGQPKRSMAAKLSGVSVSFREEQKILHSDYNKLVSQYTSISDEASETSDDGSRLSDLSEESDESVESCVLIDNVPDISEKLVGMTGDLDYKTKLCSENSDLLQEVPLEQDSCDVENKE